MFEILGLNMKQIYPALVVSTMSSGKSTLINAIIGKELLPSSNCACTAKAAAVLDNDSKPHFGLHVVDEEGRYYFRERATGRDIAEFNKANNVDEMIIEGDIHGIRNGQKALLLVDTPGLNYCMDRSHEMVTKEVLDFYQSGLILYVMDVQQIGTYDDSNAMKLIVKKIKDAPDFKVIFVINKMDDIDPEKEKLGELVENCRKYIQEQGIEKPVLIPVSARSALLLKRVINREVLSLEETEDFECSYKRFKRSGYSLVDYLSVPGRSNGGKILTVGSKEYTCAELYAALDNTGLPFLERKIDEVLALSSKVVGPEIKVKKAAERKARKEEWKKSIKTLEETLAISDDYTELQKKMNEDLAHSSKGTESEIKVKKAEERKERKMERQERRAEKKAVKEKEKMEKKAAKEK